jgi:hypothetical protein
MSHTRQALIRKLIEILSFFNFYRYPLTLHVSSVPMKSWNSSHIKDHIFANMAALEAC